MDLMGRFARMRGARAPLLVLGLVLATVDAWGAPAEDHQRGVQAYRRGDVVGAIAALRPPAQAGHAPSQTLLAFILDRADFADEAARLYQAAAAQDDPEGHAGLANAYLTGRGIAKDEKRAWQHFSKAAELGHLSSIEVVANAHAKGQFGLAVNAAKAQEWRQRATARVAASAPAAR
jgi:TPR repeat protein